MSTSAAQTAKIDRYVVIHVATTCDEHGVYVTKDSAEVIEIGWILLDTQELAELHRDSVLVKPVNTPITPLCTSLTTLTWEHVRNAGTFKDAIARFDEFAQRELLSKNLEFVFVTLDSWDLRVQLPREARDKNVVLPPYLQHSRTYDLRQEYSKWQQRHPESLPYGPSSLTNICAALEVEPVASSAPIKHNLPFHLQALAPASPRRAMEESITLARVLRGLIRKSQPQHEHPDILSRPMDARADVQAFLKERSKVLHLNGLPHDTTQSELESWFTQFGGRPIAFWTLRTPDQHKPTGSGFAVFSSHEEAAESLCMNGRALNEKAIEVSPSSSRVLDRAAEILTPFPPSKNRPRPGDWSCPSCGFSNFQRRTACFRCSFPAAGTNDPYNNYSYGGGYNGLPHMMGHPGQMHHGHQGHHGVHHGGRGAPGVVPFRAGDWRCGAEGCQYHNFAKNIACLRCGAPRSGAVPMMDQNYHQGGHQMMGTPSEYSMAPGSVASTPGPSPYGSNGFQTGAAFQHPPQQYSMPMGGPNGYPHMSGMNPGYAGSAVSNNSFSHPAAQAAFGNVENTNVQGQNGGFYGHDQGQDPFAFMTSGMSNMQLGAGDDSQQQSQAPRRNGPQNTKSPA